MHTREARAWAPERLDYPQCKCRTSSCCPCALHSLHSPALISTSAAWSCPRLPGLPTAIQVHHAPSCARLFGLSTAVVAATRDENSRLRRPLRPSACVPPPRRRARARGVVPKSCRCARESHQRQPQCPMKWTTLAQSADFAPPAPPRPQLTNFHSLNQQPWRPRRITCRLSSVATSTPVRMNYC